MSWGVMQEKLKRVCADVLNIEKFDEEAFLEQVEAIIVPKRETLEFHLKDGRIITQICHNLRRRKAGGDTNAKKGYNHSSDH